MILNTVSHLLEGKRHDARMLAESQLLNHLQENAYSQTGEPLCLYGDPAYPHRLHLQAPYRNGQITPQMQAFNKSMSSVRVSVEWLFGDIANYFKFMDLKKNLKIGLSSVGKFYLVSALLTNALTCLYHNQTSKFFGMEPPTLYEYVSRDGFPGGGGGVAPPPSPGQGGAGGCYFS